MLEHLLPRPVGGCSRRRGGSGRQSRGVSEPSFFPVSHLYGFGLVDAEAIVVEAKKWKTVPPQHVCVGSLDRVPK